MIEPSDFYDALKKGGVGFFAGVPDSLLKSFCAYLTDNVPSDSNIIAADEGAAVGLAAGYHLSTGGIPLVYMQNSGEGNAINPLLSLVDREVYDIPVVLVIGWRGRPGIHDEPQHVKQGRVTCALLDAMEIPYCVLSSDKDEMLAQVKGCFDSIASGRPQYAFVVPKDTFAPYALKTAFKEVGSMSREEAIQAVVDALPDDTMYVSTTGMASRELYEIRDRARQTHVHDFLTVGSMGHASQIALGVALNSPKRRVCCIDGDGALIMHMGSMGVVASRHPRNLVHVVINNGAHDSVGGQPTVSSNMDLPKIALACGYDSAFSAETPEKITDALREAEGTAFLEIKVRRGARKDLGRPKSTPVENKENFMKELRERNDQTGSDSGGRPRIEAGRRDQEHAEGVPGDGRHSHR